LFFYGYPGVIEIKCPRCGTYNLFTPKDPIRGREKAVKVNPEPREVHDEES
jgi:phage FluMu protein Com